jgi:hypothetical protein
MKIGWFEIESIINQMNLEQLNGLSTWVQLLIIERQCDLEGEGQDKEKENKNENTV